MRRKSERFATKKTKASPEKKGKVDKSKRTRTSRRKHSSSSDNDAVEDVPPMQVPEVSKAETEPPPIPVKEDSPEESQDQVWQVKASDTSGDGGEIKKLKICLTRPPSTPERVDRSPRSKRKHSRATSSSDTPSVESDEKKKPKHRSKRSATDSKDESEKNHDSQGEELEVEQTTPLPESSDTGKEAGMKEAAPDDTPMSTTNEESKSDKVDSESSEKQVVNEATSESSVPDKASDADIQEKTSDADTTVASPKPENNEEKGESTPDQTSPERKQSMSPEKSEVLELHAEDSRCESSEVNLNECQDEDSKNKLNEESYVSNKVSISEIKTEISDKSESNVESKLDTNKTDVVESSQSSQVDNAKPEHIKTESIESSSKDVGHVSVNNSQEEVTQSPKVHNGQAAPLVINRKRRWGSRPSKLTTQKSITISTDVLKEIIPDVKPVEFDEVVEEKKHKRVEVPERVDRPVLPKIVIDNTESIEINKKEQRTENKEKDIVKIKEMHLSSNRKISIVKDGDSIIARPPSPPRHKQSNILYITNLVRPFTLPQLKNLLQRTGRIDVENGFWIDKIKSKCFVKYETEDQAVETRHALHGVTWPVSNPKSLHVDFSSQEEFDKAKANEDTDNAKASTIPGTVEDWLREQDLKRERGETEKPWERKTITREWDVGKNEKDKEVIRPDKAPRDERLLDKRRHRTPERSPEPARKFKKKEEEAPAKLLDDLFRKTKTTPCIYWLPLSAETIAIKEEQRRQHMAEHERRLQELRRTHRRH